MTYRSGAPVGVDVDDRDGRAHRRHLRHDVRQLRIERRRLVDEVEAGRLGDLGQTESITRLADRRRPRQRPACRRRSGGSDAGVASIDRKRTTRRGLAFRMGRCERADFIRGPAGLLYFLILRASRTPSGET